MRKLIFLVLGLVFISGCSSINIPGLSRGQTGEVTEFPPDIITISNENVIPNPVSAEDVFTVSFEVKNIDDINEINNVKVELFDWGLCNPNIGSDWTVDQGMYIRDLGTLSPQQTEFIEWQFSAPSNDQIANLPAECPIRYKVVYDFVANTQTNMLVISSDRLAQLQRAGQNPTFTSSETIGRGPVKINIEFGTTLPIRTSEGTTTAACEGTATDCSNFNDETSCNAQAGCNWDSGTNTCPTTIGECSGLSSSQCENREGCSLGSLQQTFTRKSILPIFITIDDKGEGLLRDITPNMINLSVPSSFSPVRCDAFEVVSGDTWRNNGTIPMIKKASPTKRCSFAMPTADIVPIEKTYFLFGNMSYTYDLTGEMSVNVKPSLGG
jgi:hypothetical protein